MGKSLFILLLCLETSIWALSARDQMFFERYTTADGLPGSRVTSMCEDEDGHIWMNTWNGLCEWDGQKLTGIISAADGQRFGRTTGMKILRDGRLVFQNDNKEKMCFDPKKRMLCGLPASLDTIPQPVSQIEYEEGENGLEFRRKGVTYMLPYDDGLRMELQFHYMFEDRLGQLWFDFNNSLYRVWFEPSPFCLFQHWPEGQHFRFQSTVRSLSTNEEGDLLAASRNYKMYGLNDSVIDVPYPGNVYEMVPDLNYKRIWLALRKKGLYYYSKETGMMPAMDDLAVMGLSDLFSLLKLRDQPYLWCGTWGAGVRIVDISSEKPTLKRTLSNDSLTAVHKMIQLSNGLVGVCSTRGFHLYSASGVPVYVIASDLDVLNAVELPDERIYLCAMGKGQYIMETNGRLVPDVTSKVEDRISTLYRVGESDIWMVSDTRLFRYNFVSGKVDQMDCDDFGSNISFAENSIALCHDSLLYIGTSSGILEVNLNEIDSYLVMRDKQVAKENRAYVIRVSIYVCLVIVLLVSLFFLNRFYVGRKVKKQIGPIVKIAPKERILSNDREFVNKLTSIMNQMISNQDADISQLPSLMGMPKNAFYVRCNEALHSTPAAILQDMRIEFAKSLMEKGNNSVKEVSYKVGFNDPKYFSKVFKAKVGMTPSQFLEKLQ